MKCYKCNSEWKNIKTIKYPDKCPFCGNYSLEISTEEDIIKSILREQPETIFENFEAYKGCLQDTLPNIEDKLLDSLLFVEKANLHAYYKNASCSLQKKDILLLQAKEIIKVHCPDSNYGSRIETIYRKAFFENSEGIAKRDYCDRDNAYLKLAEKLEQQARYTDSFCVLLVSIESGNDYAYDIICNNIEKVHFIDADIDINYVEEIFNKLLTTKKHFDYLKLANLYAYGDFIGLKDSKNKALTLFGAAKDSELAQAEILIRTYLGYGTQDKNHQMEILKMLGQNAFAVQMLHIVDSDCRETTKKFLLSNNESVSSIAIKLCYQMALYYWNNRKYENAFLFWLRKCITFQKEENDLLSIEQLMPINIGELMEKYRYRLPSDKFLFRLIYEYCEYNNLYEEGYLYFEYAAQYVDL